MIDENNKNQPFLPTYKIKDGDLLELWKYFQDRVDTLKERQWTIGTWILTLMSGLIAFALSQQTLSITQNWVDISQPIPSIFLGIVGILLCFYGWGVLLGYGNHIRSNWSRADRVKQKILSLDYFWRNKSDNEPLKQPGFPSESKYLMLIVTGYFLIFVLISILSFVRLFIND